MKDGAVKQFAGVSGKKVEAVETVFEDGRSHVFIRFVDKKVLCIEIQTPVKVVGHWHDNRDGNWNSIVPLKDIFGRKRRKSST
jgi:hypothetical protein